MILYFFSYNFLSYHRQGIIQPCRVGEDGKPVPVEHVLELVEARGGKEIKKTSEEGAKGVDDSKNQGN